MRLRGKQNKMKGKGRFLLHSHLQEASFLAMGTGTVQWLGLPSEPPGLKEENTRCLTTALVCQVLTSFPIWLCSFLFRGLMSLLWVLCPGLTVVIGGRNGLGGLLGLGQHQKWHHLHPNHFVWAFKFIDTRVNVLPFSICGFITFLAPNYVYFLLSLSTVIKKKLSFLLVFSKNHILDTFSFSTSHQFSNWTI